MPHLKINTQVPFEGNFVDQADLRFAGITTVITVSFFFCVLWRDIKKKKQNITGQSEKYKHTSAK